MINNFTNFKKTNNYLWIQIIKFKNYYRIVQMEMQVLACDRQKNVAGLKQLMGDPNSPPLLIIGSPTAILV